MKIACILIPHLPLQVERRNDPALADRPLVIGGRPWDDEAVLDCCPQATAAGIRPGMRLFRAQALCPSANFIPANEEAYRAAHDALLSAARCTTPTVETAALGQAYAEVSGLERQVGTDGVLARHLALSTVHITGLGAGVGLARTKFAAEQAARAAPPGRGVVVPAGDERSYLASLPLSLLPADPEMQRRLGMLGVHTLGRLAALPRPAVVRQFGAHAGPLHDLASGVDPRPVQPDAPPLAVERVRTFDEPLAEHPPLLAHARGMAAELGRMLTRQGYQAEGLRLHLEQEDGQISQAGSAVKPPSADGEKLGRLAGQILDRLTPGAPVTCLVLVTYPLRPAYLGANQLSFFDRARDGRHERLREVLRGLRARFGELVIMVAALVGPPPPRPVQVTIGPAGLPRALVWHDRIDPVAQVYEVWRERRCWWGRPVERDYYRLEMIDGQVRVVFQEVRSRQWLLERQHI
jgi:nucleotidyltransferase/DNA polymerase involved in DNA repair